MLMAKKLAGNENLAQQIEIAKCWRQTMLAISVDEIGCDRRLRGKLVHGMGRVGFCQVRIPIYCIRMIMSKGCWLDLARNGGILHQNLNKELK